MAAIKCRKATIKIGAREHVNVKIEEDEEGLHFYTQEKKDILFNHVPLFSKTLPKYLFDFAQLTAAEFLVSWKLIFGIQSTTKRTVALSYVTINLDGDHVKAKRWSIRISLDSEEEVNDVLEAYSKTAGLKSPEHWLILVNSFTRRKNQQVLTELVIPMLREAQFTTDVIESSKGDYMSGIMSQIDRDRYQGVIIIGGDGSVHECVTGMLNRVDWKRFANFPVCAFPGGSCNGTSAELGISDPVWSVFSVIRGTSRLAPVLALEVTSIRVPDDSPPEVPREEVRRLYTHMNVSFGLLADLDLKSDKYRNFLGPRSRITLSALMRNAAMRSYPASIEYIPATVPAVAGVEEFPVTTCGPDLKISAEESDHDGSSRLIQLKYYQEVANWKPYIADLSKNGPYYNFVAYHINHLGRNCKISIKEDDIPTDALRLCIWPHRQGISRMRARIGAMKCILKECFSAVHDDPILCDRLTVQAFRFTFPTEVQLSGGDGRGDMLVAISGEPFEKIKSVYGETVPSVLTLITSPFDLVELGLGNSLRHSQSVSASGKSKSPGPVI